VLAAALNYKSHLTGREAPKNPEFFFKPPSCLIASGEPIVMPPGSEDVHYEAEMVIVIGRRARNVSTEDALDHVLGVTCGNDVSARDWQEGDIQWWRAKGADTFGPVGPVIVSGLDYDNLELEGRLNGQVKQHANTNDLLFGVAQLVSFASRHVTLEPGDLIFTGAPGTTSQLSPGDVFEVEIKGVGVLTNPVKGAR
jgi:2-keto-4-pentenoate hydratase/2-oxohepta-3-ene-1,7-dioic acid hydratase in catechol pathway